MYIIYVGQKKGKEQRAALYCFVHVDKSKDTFLVNGNDAAKPNIVAPETSDFRVLSTGDGRMVSVWIGVDPWAEHSGSWSIP